jgi:hypothetical protein
MPNTETPAPHAGPGKEPERSVTIEDLPDYEATPEIKTISLGAPAPETTLEETPSPEDPEKAVEKSTSETRMGELTRALGEQKKDFDQRLAEMELNYEARLAAMASPAVPVVPPTSQLPANVDPDAQMTVGQFVQAMDRMWPFLQDQLIRTQWDVTPEEEQSVLQANPHFANIQDSVQRTGIIRKAVKLARDRKGETKPEQPASSPASGKSDSRQTRTPGKTVPHVEASTTPATPDHTPENPSEQILSEYEQAKTISDPKKRMSAMKKAFKKAKNAAGLSDEVFGKMKFSQKASITD